MKKVLIFTVLTLFALNLLGGTAFAAGEPKVTVGSVSANAGETVEVPIMLSGNTGFCNIAIEVGYDKSVLTLTGAVSSVIGAGFTKAQDFSVLPYNMQWDSTDNVPYNGTLVTLTFTVKNTAADGAYPITVEFYKGRNGNNIDGKSVNYNADRAPLNLTYVNGSVTIAGQAEPVIEITSADTQNLSFGVHLQAEAYSGHVLAGLYDAAGRMVAVRQYQAAETVNVSFGRGLSGAFIKVMWLETSSLKPVCPALTRQLG